MLRSVFWWGSSVTMSVLNATVSVLPAAHAGAGRHAVAAGTAARSSAINRMVGDTFFITALSSGRGAVRYFPLTPSGLPTPVTASQPARARSIPPLLLKAKP